MTAAVLYGREDLRLEQVPVPKAGAGEIVLRVGAALTCGTDLKVYRRGYHAMMLTPPIPFGHEVAGVISEVGEGVNAFQAGDRVVALNSAPCDRCFWCEKGQQNLCEDLLFNNGAYAEYMRVPARIVERNTLVVPAEMPLEHAALTEPLGCVLRGMEESGATAGDTLVVIGAGPIGLMFLHVAELSGMRAIAVIRRESQRAAAMLFGAAEVVVAGGSQETVAEVRALTQDARGVDVAVEAVATSMTWKWAVEMARRGGVVNFFGGPPSGTVVSLDTDLLHYGDIKLLASFHHTPSTCKAAFDLLRSGRFKCSEYITGRAGLGDVPALFKRMLTRNTSSGVLDIKTAVFPAGVAL